MATVSITSWRTDGTTWSGWAPYARAELTRRLRSSVNLSPAARRELERQVKAHELAVIRNVDLSYAESLRHILEALGANVAVDPAQEIP